MIVGCWIGDGLRWRLTSSSCPSPPSFGFDQSCFVTETFCYCMIFPQKRSMNEMCEYPCVFALYMSENVEMVERKGEREFALCLFQPSFFLCFILSPPYPFILSLPVKFVFLSFCVYLKLNYSCFSNSNTLFFHYLWLPYCVSIFII